MLKTNILTLLAIAFSITSSLAQFTDVINSNRPGQSMAAFSVGKTVIQSEMGVNYSKEKYEENPESPYKGVNWTADLTLRYGVFFEQFELIANFEYQNERITSPFFDRHDTGLKRTTIGAKYLLYDPDRDYEQKPNLYSWKANHKFNWRQFIPAVAFYGGANFNLAPDKFRRPEIPKEDGFTLKGMILTQNQFGRYTFLTNIIVDKFPSQRNSLDYVLTMTRGFNSRVSGFVEIQGYNNVYYTDHFFRTGAAYLLKQNLQIDASVSSNFQNAPNIFVAGVGASWRFDANYSEVMLRVAKEDKRSKLDKKSDKIKDKKKEKEKKRIDAVDGDKAK